jgi:NAD(P)-dependent dehydrogenase (short-subunit alcohol dehydrogenase family)
MRLKNKVAIITGGGAGIGKAVAERFASEGAHVVVAEIDAKNGESTADAIKTTGGEALFVRTDVSQENEVKAMVKAALERYARIDILFNNAAIIVFGKDTRAHELTNEVWDRTLAVNLTGYWLCAKYVIPAMLKQGRGVIINVASPTGMLGFQNITAYSASKGGVFGLTRAMAADYAPDHIRVNAIVPGAMDTPMNAEEFSDPEARKKYTAITPAGRLGLADDVSGMAVFLATEDSDYCVGGIYMVDGGATAI